MLNNEYHVKTVIIAVSFVMMLKFKRTQEGFDIIPLLAKSCIYYDLL